MGGSFLQDLNPFLLPPVTFLLLGLTFIWLGMRTRSSSRRLGPTASRASGVVTELRYVARAGGSGGGLYYPVLRFSTADGRQVDTLARYGRRPALVSVGEQVTVLYDPADPAIADLEGMGAVLGDTDGGCLGTGLVVVGSAFVGLGLLTGAGLVFALSTA